MDAPVKKRFKFNYSHLKNFESCPRRHYEVDVLHKWAGDPQSDEMKWGNDFHAAVAARLREKAPLRDRLAHYEDLMRSVEEFPMPGKRVSIECGLAFNNQFKAVDYGDPAWWYRCKLDVLMIAEPNALIFDWKTGKRTEKYVDFLQLALYAGAVFQNWPEIQRVGVQYVWIGDPIVRDPKVFERDEMTQVWNEIFRRLQPYMEAQETKHYPERDNPFCARHCPVIDCLRNGRR